MSKDTISNDFEYREDEFDDPEEDEMTDCGLMPDGQCLMAGSEHCDFVCSMRESEFFAGSRAWRKAHGEKT